MYVSFYPITVRLAVENLSMMPKPALAKKILIIDDDLIFVKIYESLFQSEGFVVDLAHDAKSAMDQLIGARPDLVLLDLFLGKVNGVHVLKEIRSRPTIRSIPVIVLSTSRSSRLVDAAWRAGANRCLWKDDFDPDQVLDVVNGTLSPGESLPETLSGTQTIDESKPLRIARHAARVPWAADEIRRTYESNLQLDSEAQYRLRRSFARGAIPVVAELRDDLHGLIESTEPRVREGQLQRFEGSVSELRAEAETMGLEAVARFCEALSRLIAELRLDSDSIQPSPLNTLTQAVSFLGKLLDGAAHKHINAYPQVTVLAVDDDQTSRWMIRSGLNLAGLKPICIGDPRIALSICEENAADLICIDAAMPGMNGFELCSRIRDFPINKNSSVLFVTGYGGFESRVRSSRAGGDDFIAKPFLLNELGLKALVHILDGQL